MSKVALSKKRKVVLCDSRGINLYQQIVQKIKAYRGFDPKTLTRHKNLQNERYHRPMSYAAYLMQ